MTPMTQEGINQSIFDFTFHHPHPTSSFSRPFHWKKKTSMKSRQLSLYPNKNIQWELELGARSHLILILCSLWSTHGTNQRIARVNFCHTYSEHVQCTPYDVVVPAPNSFTNNELSLFCTEAYLFISSYPYYREIWHLGDRYDYGWLVLVKV